MVASNSNNTSTFIEEIQRYECLYNKLSKDYKKRRTRENVWETIGQKFGLTAEALPKTDAFFDVLSSSSSQNITANQITSQKSSSSIDSRHFNFDLGGKKFLLPVFFTVWSDTNDLMETKESQESLQSRLSFLHLGRLFSSDRDDSIDSDDYLETGLKQPS